MFLKKKKKCILRTSAVDSQGTYNMHKVEGVENFTRTWAGRIIKMQISVLWKNNEFSTSLE